MLNADKYNAHGNFFSVREYFLRMSQGKLDYSNVVTGPIQLSKHRNHYIENPMFGEVLDAVAQMGIDLAPFDSKKEGFLDAISSLYAGKNDFSKRSNGAISWLWPHNHIFTWQHGGYRMNYYQISGIGVTPGDMSIGTFCHESGHMLARFPALYDYGGDHDGMIGVGNSYGMGRYCLMSSGNHLDDGKAPAPICGDLRYLANWSEPVDIKQSGIYSVKHGDYGKVYRYPTSKGNEYFIIENRLRLGFDGHLQASGLAVYHCDILGSNEWHNNTEANHYQCGLLQSRFALPS